MRRLAVTVIDETGDLIFRGRLPCETRAEASGPGIIVPGLSGIGHEAVEHGTHVGVAPKPLSVARVITARNLKPEFVAFDGSAERWIHLPQLQQLRRICEAERPQ